MAETEREGGFTLSHFGLKGHETSSAGKAWRVGRLYLWWQEQEAPGSQLCRERQESRSWTINLELAGSPLPSVRSHPLKGLKLPKTVRLAGNQVFRHRNLCWAFATQTLSGHPRVPHFSPHTPCWVKPQAGLSALFSGLGTKDKFGALCFKISN